MLDKIKYKETSTKCAILFVGHTNLKGGIIMLKFQNNDTTIIACFGRKTIRLRNYYDCSLWRVGRY